MTPELPYTHENPEAPGEQIIVDRLRVTVCSRHDGYSVSTPRGEDAAKLARAVVAAGGADCVVLTSHDLVSVLRAAEASGARRMRDAVDSVLADAIPSTWYEATADQISALPLIPDDEGAGRWADTPAEMETDR